MQYYQTLIASIIFHLIFVWLASFFASPPAVRRALPVEVVYEKPQDEKRPSEKTLVRESDAPNKRDKPKEKARFFSETTKSFEEEMGSRYDFSYCRTDNVSRSNAIFSKKVQT